MAIGSGKSEEYALFAAEALKIDNQVQQLLDELVATLSRGPAAGQLEQKAQSLASQAAQLAGELDGADQMDMNEKTVMLEALTEQAERLMANAPDAIIASEQEKWAGELEAIQTHLQAMKSSMNALALPHISGSQRVNHEK